MARQGVEGGKTYGSLLEPLRHLKNSEFSSVTFRRTTKQIRNTGALWDSATSVYAKVGGFISTPSTLEFRYRTGMKIQFAHMEYEKNKYDWQGTQIPLIQFEELTHFTSGQFWYMLSRNRSTSGVPGYIRATCNADSESWVRGLVDWWIDKESGYAIPERAGVIRWFIRVNDELHWADTPQELLATYGDKQIPKSFTFIPAKLEDNQIFMQEDPAYAANLDALPYVDRMQLKFGNWNIKATAGTLFRREWFPVQEAHPPLKRVIRYWDRAATLPNPQNPDPDWTVGTKIGLGTDERFYVLHVVRFRNTPAKVEEAIKRMAQQDGVGVEVHLEMDPGQAGVAEKNTYTKLLRGYDLKFPRPAADKVTRAKPASAQAENGNIVLLRGNWNEDFLTECENFPEGKKDQVDTLSGGVNALAGAQDGEYTDSMAQPTEEAQPPVASDPEGTVDLNW